MSRSLYAAEITFLQNFYSQFGNVITKNELNNVKIDEYSILSSIGRIFVWDDTVNIPVNFYSLPSKNLANPNNGNSVDNREIQATFIHEMTHIIQNLRGRNVSRNILTSDGLKLQNRYGADREITITDPKEIGYSQRRN